MSVFTYDSHEIFYKVDGSLTNSTTPIIILNGIMMSTASWDAFKPAFSEHNTLVRYDMLDQGQSSKASKQYTQELQVDILHALIEHLNVKKVHLVGISYGASIALQYTIKHQDKVAKLVVANAVMKTSPWLKAIGDGWNQVGETRNGLAYYNITIPYIYSPMFYKQEIKWMEERKKMLIPIFSDPTFLDAMKRLTISAETHDTTKDCQTIKRETLIISGDHDFLTPVFEQRKIHQAITNSELVIIPDCGHASMYEHPNMFTHLVLGFINNSKTVKII